MFSRQYIKGYTTRCIGDYSARSQNWILNLIYNIIELLSLNSFLVYASLGSPSTDTILVGTYLLPVSLKAEVRLVVGGGFFAGGIVSKEDEVEPGSRYDPKRLLGQVSPALFRQHR